MTHLIEVQGVCKHYGGVTASRTATWRSTRARSTASSAPTGRARRPCSTSSRAMSGSSRARSTTAASRSPTPRLTASSSSASGAPSSSPACSRASPCWRTCWSPPSATRAGCAASCAGRARRGRSGAPWSCWTSSGIARLAHEPAGNLSYGQRKLLELASLLVADPAVLLLDEPAGGVNPTLIGHLADRIAELNRGGKTILVVEHNMEFVMSLCSRVTVLSQGTALVSGTPSEVRTNPAVLDAYLGGEDDASTQQRARRRGRRPPSPAASRRAHPHHARPNRVDGPPALLSIRGVTAGYGGGDILKEVSLDVPRGGITCVVGPNGAGKSTLLATISGLLRPRAGEIEFDGALISGMTPQADPGPRVGADPSGAQPVHGHDRARERRDGGVHRERRRAGRAAAARRGGAVSDRPRARRREGRQPVGRPAAPGGVRAVPDARP